MEHLKAMLDNPEVRGVVCSTGGEIVEFHSPGVKDLYCLVATRRHLLDGACVADRVIGRGAALLLAMGHVSQVFAQLISEQAVQVLQAAEMFNVGFNPDYRHVFETQLKKLHTDYLDFYLIHAIGDNTIHPYVDDGSVAYLIEQKEKGRIRNLGFSCHASIESLRWFVEQYDWEFAQIQLNCFDWLFSHTQEEYKILEERNIPIVVMEPVRGGRLSRLVPEAEAMLREAHPDWSLASWMFRFVRSLPQVQVILSGMSTMEQVEDNLRTFDDDNNFTDADRDLLFRAMEMFKSQMQVPCTACRYCCDDCPMGINIPEFLKLYNKYKVDGDFGLKDLLAKVESISPPSECLNCGSCASHCPQNIDIPSIMTEMGEKFY